MKEYVLELASRQKGFNAKLNIMREYLQAYILRIIYEDKLFRTAAFIGGTALRFLYDLPRFSEDLDFSVEPSQNFNFIELIKKVKKELILAGYNISVVYNDQRMVKSSFVKFEELMYEAGISPLKKQNFSIKIEIDTNPPAGAVLETKIVNKYFPVGFLSYNLESLFAGKLHAFLSREYIKGRDFFDVGWYLSKWKNLSPNMKLLQNALKQTLWKGAVLSRDNWRDFIYKVVQKTDWKKIHQDIEKFLENPSDINIFTKENMLKLIKGADK